MKKRDDDGAASSSSTTTERRRRRTTHHQHHQQHRHDPFTVGLLSGCAAGLTVNACLFPLNTVKTRLQARAVGSAWRSPNLFKGLYRGFVIDTLGRGRVHSFPLPQWSAALTRHCFKGASHDRCPTV